MVLEFKHISVHYRVEGEGDTLVLLHGFLENLSMWDAFIPELTENYKVVRVDLLGHGRTGCLGEVHSMDLMAEAVKAVLDHLYISSAKLLGHSMGGYVALALAEAHPGLVQDLILMNSNFEADPDDRKQLRTSAISTAGTNYEALIRLSFANLFAPVSRVSYRTAYEAALQEALKTPLQGYIAAQEGMKQRPNRFEVFKSIPGQQIVIVGHKDQLISVDALKSKLKNTRIELVEFAQGHMSHIEDKSELSYFFKRLIEK